MSIRDGKIVSHSLHLKRDETEKRQASCVVLSATAKGVLMAEDLKINSLGRAAL